MRDEAVPHLIRAAGEAAVAAYRSYFESASRTAPRAASTPHRPGGSSTGPGRAA